MFNCGILLSINFRDLQSIIADLVGTSRCLNVIKGKDYCPIEIIKGLTDNGQFHYLTKLKGPQVGNYLYIAQFLPLR